MLDIERDPSVTTDNATVTTYLKLPEATVVTKALRTRADTLRRRIARTSSTVSHEGALQEPETIDLDGVTDDDVAEDVVALTAIEAALPDADAPPQPRTVKLDAEDAHYVASELETQADDWRALGNRTAVYADLLDPVIDDLRF